MGLLLLTRFSLWGWDVGWAGCTIVCKPHIKVIILLVNILLTLNNFYDMRFINLHTPIFICCLILLISCNKKDDNGLIGPDIELVEIIDPPDIPGIYTQCLIQPKVLVKNDGIINVDSLDISYSILIDTNIYNYTNQFGPSTRWTNTIKPGDEVIINLTKWDTINGNTPLYDGTYTIYVWLSRFLPNDKTRKEKSFILEL